MQHLKDIRFKRRSRYLAVNVIVGAASGIVAGVGNQHKWDRLGPEKIIIMKSCVGAP